MFTPTSLFGMWFRGILSIIIIGSAIYLLYLWQDQLPRSVAVVNAAELDQAVETRPLPSFRERLTVWRPGWDKVTAFLAGGLFLSGWAVSGSWFYPRLFRRSGDFNTEVLQTGKIHHVQRPDGTVLHVKCFGGENFPRLILSHGWGGDHKMWNYVVKKFADNYRVIVWDLPGSGGSTQPSNKDYSLGKFAADLRAVIETTGDQPAILVGHSIGGMTTLTFCKMYPHLLKTLVQGIAVVHTTYTNPLKTTRFATLWTTLQKPLVEPLLWLTILLSPFVWLMNCLSYLNGSAHRSTDRDSFAGNETKGQLDFVARYSIKSSPKVIGRGMLGMLDYDVAAELAHIDVPSLVVVGDLDSTTKPQAGEYIHAQIRDSNLVAIEPAKHLGFFEQHESFNQSLQTFVANTFAAHDAHNRAVVAASNN